MIPINGDAQVRTDQGNRPRTGLPCTWLPSDAAIRSMGGLAPNEAARGSARNRKAKPSFQRCGVIGSAGPSPSSRCWTETVEKRGINGRRGPAAALSEASKGRAMLVGGSDEVRPVRGAKRRKGGRGGLLAPSKRYAARSARTRRRWIAIKAAPPMSHIADSAGSGTAEPYTMPEDGESKT